MDGPSVEGSGVHMRRNTDRPLGLGSEWNREDSQPLRLARTAIQEPEDGERADGPWNTLRHTFLLARSSGRRASRLPYTGTSSTLYNHSYSQLHSSTNNSPENNNNNNTRSGAWRTRARVESLQHVPPTQPNPPTMRLLYYSLTLYLSTLTTSGHASPSPVADAAPARETSAAPQQPCTVRSPNTGAFFDINPLHIEDPALSKAKHPRDYSWNTTGWGLPYNFTMNFCGPVVEELGEEGVVGVEKEDWGNVSAFYRQGGKTYSIG
ncbi:hypothetical protein D0869_13117 [Hortaea werneckii]|uniref:Uncharacterized protein n=1 Tax=Hortaea werneckii TaxID=91943 RepID=A0A3M6W6T1_HORWE|nr:hypothetical protein D0869_13117 [Hortaea werneckii]